MNGWSVYTWRGVLGSLLLALSFYGFFFGVLGLAVLIGKLL